MSQPQTLETILVDQLQEKVRALRAQNYRLVQISATRMPDQVELTYSFDLNSHLTSLRLSVPGHDAYVPSISAIYGCAILYENELHDLFNVKVEGLAVDFGGNFYKTSIKFPFGSTKAPCATPPKPPAPVASTVAPGGAQT